MTKKLDSPEVVSVTLKISPEAIENSVYSFAKICRSSIDLTVRECYSQGCHGYQQTQKQFLILLTCQPPHPAPHVHLLSMDDLDDTFEINI